MFETTEKFHRWEKFAQNATILAAPLALLVIVLLTVFSFWHSTSSPMDLDIIAHREDAPPDAWTLSGRVRLDGNDVAGARVWVILRGDQGNRDSPPAVVTAADGQFAIPRLPNQVGGRNIRSTVIYARFTTKEGKNFRGEELLSAIGDARPLGTTGAPAAIGLLALLLLVSMLLPFLGGTPGRTRYVLSVVVAILFNFGVIGAVGYGMYKLYSPVNEGRAVTLGFVSVFRGSYIDHGPPQWLISVSDPVHAATAAAPAPSPSSPLPSSSAPASSTALSAAVGAPAAATDGPAEKGFGAPLWVVLLAVVGSVILTVSLITREIREPPDSDPTKLREKIHNAVQHQVYVLFAPVAAIFVYQAMVVTATASNSLVVAFAALGAGAALNALLKRAVESATGLFSKPAPPAGARSHAAGAS